MGRLSLRWGRRGLIRVFYRNFLGSVAIPGQPAAAAVPQNQSHNLVTPRCTALRNGRDCLLSN